MKIDSGGRPSYLLALIPALSAVTLHAAPACKYVKFGSLPMAVDGRLPYVDGVVNGAAMHLLIDAGASTTSLTGRLAERLHLTLGHTEIGAIGVSGESATHTTLLREFSFGPVH